MAIAAALHIEVDLGVADDGGLLDGELGEGHGSDARAGAAPRLVEMPPNANPQRYLPIIPEVALSLMHWG